MTGSAPPELVLDLDGFEGPIGLLLMLAREQKVDLRRISILALAEQYLAFIAAADRLHLDLAADYLVMAAWLAYLKSRLLLPEPPGEAEPSARDLAEALAFRLQRLEAMQQAAAALFARPLLGRDVFEAGAPAEAPPACRMVFDASLYDLLKAYGSQHRRGEAQVLQIRAPQYFSVEDALGRLGSLIGTVVEWRQLVQFLPPQLARMTGGDTGLAATFTASLELARTGRIELRQETAFGPIWLRAARPQP
jgi:segregation and condensation protein A